MTNRKRLVFTLTAAIALVGIAAQSAVADGTRRTVVEEFNSSYAFSVDCGEFQNDVSGEDNVRVTEVRAGDGSLLQVVFAVRFKETDTNSATGATVRLSGALHEVWDLHADTRTINGKVFMGSRPGFGAVVHDTGRIVTGLDDHSDLRFVAGPHEVYFDDLDRMVCEALAA